MKILSENKKAYFDYEILDKFEAGILLLGLEVKSIRSGKTSLKGSYVIIKDNEAFLVGFHIPPYQTKNTPQDYIPERPRKLLLNKKELSYLLGKSKEKGLTLIPLKVYTKKALIKIEFGIAKGKKKYQKKEILKKKEIDKRIKRIVR